MGYRQPRSFIDILSKTPYLPTDALFHKSGSVRLKQPSSRQMPHSNLWQVTTTNMRIPSLKLTLAPMWPSKIPARNFGTFMALLQLYHPTGNITLKLPVAGYWSETAAFYAEEFHCPCQHMSHSKTLPLPRLPKNFAAQLEPGNHPIV